MMCATMLQKRRIAEFTANIDLVMPAMHKLHEEKLTADQV